MFDIGWSELAVIAVVALVVIGPKDLPKVLRTVGMWVRKARSIASEFQSSIDQMARESELADMRKQIEEASKLNLADEVQKAVDPDRSLARSLDVDPLAAPSTLADSVATDSPPASASAAPAEPAALPSPAFEPLPDPAAPAVAAPAIAAPPIAAPAVPAEPKQGSSDRG